MEKGDPSLALGTSSMTLLELTAAYAAVAANSYPVEPRAFKAEEKGWFENLISGPSSFGSDEHEEIEQMLRAAVNRGTGRAARLPQANFGKTGTSQDNRDALFVGYANGLVVGVWIGNDDNTPLKGISGGGLPARIWRDFMTEASGKKGAAAAKGGRPDGPCRTARYSRYRRHSDRRPHARGHRGRRRGDLDRNQRQPDRPAPANSGGAATARAYDRATVAPGTAALKYLRAHLSSLT